MKRGTGIVKKSSCGRGLFAKVALEIESAEKFSFQIDIDENPQKTFQQDVIYLTAIEAAIILAQEKLFLVEHRTDLSKMSFSLKNLETTFSDTTFTTVLYATLLAIEDALDITIPDITADWENRELGLKF